MAADPYRYFRLEARELLDQCAQTVLELEKGGPAATLVQQLLRLVHTLKGAARVVRQAGIADGAHAIEDALAPLRDATAGVTRDALGPILDHLDSIDHQLRMLSPVEPVASAAANSLPDEPWRAVRADVVEMDMVLDGVAETHGLLTRLRDAERGLEQAQRLAEVLKAQLAVQRHHGGASERLLAIADELQRKVGTVERGLGSTVDQMDRELQQLRDAAERLRLVPAGSLFTVLERTALDAARTLGKQVKFRAEGDEMRLDSHMLGAIQSALIQLIRNAVAHGIEAADVRRRAGKPEIGDVGISISRRGRRVVFECRDDGGGLDLESIRRVASRRGVSGPDVRHADASALVQLLLRGGITTSETVTEVSGRGIGLDVVRAAIERLGGEVVVRTERGWGTVFELVVPSSLAALEVLIVEAGGSGAIAIPLDAVRGTVRIGAGDILPSAPGTAVLYGQQAVTFMALSTILGGAHQSVRDRSSMVLLAGADGLAAIGVDRLLGTANLVVRPLPDNLHVSAVVAGVAFDAEGNPQLILDPDGIVSAVRHSAPGSSDIVPATARTRILVIDDSLTTRMLEQSILESAGYEVDVALSAEEGLKAAHRTRYALFLVDVEMPGMDGFTFVEQVRADPALHEIPAILVTSRAAPEDLQRGRAVGSQGYMIKSEFDQSRLLALIKPLVR
ncbi:response regulator [Acidisphaera sp. S103]|uniref:hybrid sensor histidine kinase/response regulator n=1 Tax=Acidisphaera sp. S103 TaxID=1747223 RepID=UPI00131D4024|nr:response regulator [Acidisphaera sp. S103]